MREFFLLKEFFWQNRWNYFWGILGLVCVDLLQLVPPRVLGNLADAFQKNQLNPGLIQRYALILIAVAVVIAVLRFIWRYLVQQAARGMEMHLRDLLYKHLQTLEPEYYDRHRVGDLMAHATNDLNAIRSTFGIGLVMVTDALVLTTATIFLMLTTIDARLVLVSLLPLPAVVWLATRFSRLLHNRYLKVQESFSRLTEQAQESIAGIRVIKSFVQEKPTLDKFNQASERSMQANLNLVRVAGLLFPLVQLFASLSFLIVLGYGGYLILRQEVSLGDFVALNGYLAMLIWPMMAMGWVFSIIERGKASMQRINTILQTEPQIKDAPNALAIKKAQGLIEFKSLSFSYNNTSRPALQNIELKILPGQTLGIVGRTGSGKSTLVNLLLRSYDPPDGSIWLDGLDIKKLTLQSLREQFGYVPQDSFLFSASIRSNILFGRPDADEQKLAEAVRISRLENDLASFPQGLETIIGERGVTLSGGQKQRVAIARAILADPPVLILDDAMSAVDTKTEEAILQNLKRIRQGKTTVMIAHRISTVQHADQIIFLDDGKIVEQGNHQELLQKEGRYFQLYQKQLLEQEFFAVGKE
ncbi:ABC transporter ATP-binding protein [Zhaonella formicivorans]|uniref:ABC transporter ATP-binding protein n=1 Tax=Zhaonella formicivorans TaxID=2528593 RepID=UPI0010D1AD27|nr:ABC transporter ATP-binding protein [Zhaonella formicivorans]